MNIKQIKRNWKFVLGIGYLGLQIGLIIFARFSSNRYFTWAPHDLQTHYKLEVYDKSGKLGEADLRKRYRLESQGWVDLPPVHIIEWLEAYEKHYPQTSEKIWLRYNVNGRGWQEWTLKAKKGL
ncbi:MAG: hypothetical protein AAFU64_13510 [Bacteroidota bacterium]